MSFMCHMILLFVIFFFLAGNDDANNSAANNNDSNPSNGINIDDASSLDTSPSTRQYSTVTQSTIIKRKGILKTESADVEVQLSGYI